MRKTVISLTDKELKKSTVIDQAIKGYITVKEAALALGISTRQVQRLKKKVRECGPAAIVHKNTGRKPANAISNETKQTILDLIQSDNFENCNFVHFKEILSEEYGIEIGYATLHGLLTQNGITSPKHRRRFKPHRRRSRKTQMGLLIQTDATPYRWFKEDRKYYALHGAIDDATGQLTALFMTKNECLEGYFQMLRQTIKNFGIPCSIYADRHTIFQSPNKKKAEVDSDVKVNDTQLGRALKELNITLISAKSPQAKGRVERVWQTLQSRLPIEFSINGIKNIDDANIFLERYIYKFNSQFAVEPMNAESAFTKPADGLDLNRILCIKVKRKIDSGGVFSYMNKTFKIVETNSTGYIPPNVNINVLLSNDIGIKAEYKGHIFDVLRYVPPKRKKKAETKAKAVPDPQWHQVYSSKTKIQKYDSSLCDAEILKFLDEMSFGHIERMIDSTGMY